MIEADEELYEELLLSHAAEQETIETGNGQAKLFLMILYLL